MPTGGELFTSWQLPGVNSQSQKCRLRQGQRGAGSRSSRARAGKQERAEPGWGRPWITSLERRAEGSHRAPCRRQEGAGVKAMSGGSAWGAEAGAGARHTWGLPLVDSQVTTVRIKLVWAPFYPQRVFVIIWSDRIHSELVQIGEPLHLERHNIFQCLD